MSCKGPKKLSREWLIPATPERKAGLQREAPLLKQVNNEVRLLELQRVRQQTKRISLEIYHMYDDA
jgi:hypothetical protein